MYAILQEWSTNGKSVYSSVCFNYVEKPSCSKTYTAWIVPKYGPEITPYSETFHAVLCTTKRRKNILVKLLFAWFFVCSTYEDKKNTIDGLSWKLILFYFGRKRN